MIKYKRYHLKVYEEGALHDPDESLLMNMTYEELDEFLGDIKELKGLCLSEFKERVKANLILNPPK